MDALIPDDATLMERLVVHRTLTNIKTAADQGEEITDLIDQALEDAPRAI